MAPLAMTPGVHAALGAARAGKLEADWQSLAEGAGVHRQRAGHRQRSRSPTSREQAELPWEAGCQRAGKADVSCGPSDQATRLLLEKLPPPGHCAPQPDRSRLPRDVHTTLNTGTANSAQPTLQTFHVLLHTCNTTRWSSDHRGRPRPGSGSEECTLLLVNSNQHSKSPLVFLGGRKYEHTHTHRFVYIYSYIHNYS